MKCLETRTTRDGFRRRRYRTDYGTTITTIEVPEAIWRGTVNLKVAARRTVGWRKTQAWDKLYFQSSQHKAAGWKALASAHELGLNVRIVQRWWRQGGRSRGAA